MRPGFVFIGLFALLMAVYFGFQSALGAVATIVLQAAIVLVLLGSVLWLRKTVLAPEELAPRNRPPASETVPLAASSTRTA